MSLYFAARFSRQAELRGYRDELATATGRKVTSRWLDRAPYAERASEIAGDAWHDAGSDMRDLMAASGIVLFTEHAPPEGVTPSTGGHHVEWGAAVAWKEGLRLLAVSHRDVPRPFDLIIVGPKVNVFHAHPLAFAYPDWRTFLADQR